MRAMRAMTWATFLCGVSACSGGSGDSAAADASAASGGQGGAASGSGGVHGSGGGTHGGSGAHGGSGGHGGTGDMDASMTGAGGGTAVDASMGGAGGATGHDAGGGMPGVCPGAGIPPGAACRSSADCPPGNSQCLLNPISAGCGACFPGSEHACDADTDCGTDMVCVPVIETSPCVCNPSGLPGTSCVPKCTATSCNADERCESDGHCRIRPCDDGYDCGSGFVCAAMRLGADAHGCSPATCTGDGYTCPRDFVCAAGQNTDLHGCSEVSCEDGFTCPMNYDCKHGSSASHRCEQRTCSRDADCDCGACIMDLCQPRLFVCTGAQAP